AALPQAVEAELVLDAHDVGVRAVDRPGGRPVGHGAPLPDPPADLGPIGSHRVALIDRRDTGAGRRVGLADRMDEIRREGRDPAAAGWVGGDERDTHDLQGTVAVDLGYLAGVMGSNRAVKCRSCGACSTIRYPGR